MILQKCKYLAGSMTQVADHLPGKCKILISNPSTSKKKKVNVIKYKETYMQTLDQG
jgi:hypothetical protein